MFVDSMLRHSPNADVMAFEKDLLTGTILRHLYPDQKMRTCGFEKIERPFNNYFDLAVSNIPFGDIAVFDAEFQRSDSFGRRSADVYKRQPFVRLWISSLTDKAIREGLRKLEDGSKYDNLYLAAKARSESDWLVGINGTQEMCIRDRLRGVPLHAA